MPPTPKATAPEGEDGRRKRRVPSAVLVLAAVPAMVTGAWLIHDGARTSAPPAPASAERIARPGSPQRAAPKEPAPLPASVPQRVRIPTIRVDAPLVRLGLDNQQHLQVPPDGERNLAGWYGMGPTPGARGAAVLAGHVDTLKGPAVFWGLGALHKGDTIQIPRADHRTAVFTVYGIEVYAKNEFPTSRVYGPVPGAELRVITCGGGFVKGQGYQGNVVVYARLSGTS